MEIILKKSTSSLTSCISSVNITSKINEVRFYTNMTTITAWLTNVFTKSEIDQKLEDQELYYVKQW